MNIYWTSKFVFIPNGRGLQRGRAPWLGRGDLPKATPGSRQRPGLELPTSHMDDVTREPAHADPTR